MRHQAWMFLVLNLAMANVIQNDEDTDCDSLHHLEDGNHNVREEHNVTEYHNVIKEQNNKDDLHNPDKDFASYSKPSKTEEYTEKRKPFKVEEREKDTFNMEEERKYFKVEGEGNKEREPKQLQFSRLMERSVVILVVRISHLKYVV